MFRVKMKTMTRPPCAGPPGPPVGPVKFTEVFAERIGLAWNPPTDDGGSKITNYVIEKREDNRKSWVHVSNDPKECAYVVTRLTENHEYEFRVMAQNKFGVGPPLVSEPEKARNLFSESIMFSVSATLYPLTVQFTVHRLYML